MDNPLTPTALITGAARRIGATIATYLHNKGYNVILHYHHSEQEARLLAQTLNDKRQNSAIILPCDLLQIKQLPLLINQAATTWGRLDVLVNNASSYFPTPPHTVTEDLWDDLMGSNLKAPFFLIQSAIPWLQKTKGNIINITDVNAHQPLKGYSVYSTAKAGLWMLTRALAQELAPDIRVNAIAPGTMIWAEGMNKQDTHTKNHILNKIPLARIGDPIEIAKAIGFLITEGHYITGQEIRIDGGKSIRGYLD